MIDTQKEFEKIIADMVKLRAKKNNDYGDGFIKTYNKYGKESLFFDLLRKWQRLETILLENKEIKVSDETLQDTLKDLAIMSINGMIWLNNKENGGKNK